MVATEKYRAVERVPALFVGLLEDAGKLPLLPSPIASLGQHGTHRPATLTEVAALSWIVAWDGPKLDANGFRKAAGVAAYRDVFDYHTSSDVREIIHIAGTRRGTIDLLRYMRAEANALGLRCIGSVDLDNTAMVAVLQQMGTLTRVVFEDVKP